MAINLANKQMKQGAIDALKLILQSRKAPLKLEADDAANQNEQALKMPHNVDTTTQDADKDNEDAKEQEQTRLAKIKQSMSDDEIEKDLQDIKDDTAYRNAKITQGKRDELAAIKARNTIADFKDFERDLYRTIKSQITLSKNPEDSYSRVNPTYANTDLLMPGQTQVEKREIPKIQIYFDQSGSWGDHQINKGLDALKTLANFERKKKIKINPPLFFADHLHDNPRDARREGGTGGFDEVLADIAAKLNSGKVNNIIILTDRDIDGQTNWTKLSKITVPGHVWWIWGNSPATIGVKFVDGLKGTSQYKL